MNKVTKYITTGAAAMLMLMSVGAVQTNANAARHYRGHVTRNVKKIRRQSNKKLNKNVQKNKKAKAQLNKQNKEALKRDRKFRKHVTRRNKRIIKRYADKRLNRRRNRRSNRVMKARYYVAKGKRGDRALIKSNFYDGPTLTRAGADLGSHDNWVFSKYAPFDKQAVIPNYMNPKLQKRAKAMHWNNYYSVNRCKWAVGYFNFVNPQKAKHNTKNPKVYSYNYKLRGWQLDK